MMRRNQQGLEKGGFLLEDQKKIALGRKRWGKKVELCNRVQPRGGGPK